LPTIPGYEVLDILGRGGMGVVYRARQKGLKRIVALKMILAGGHAAPDQLARFHAEAEAVAQLLHPNIVQVYDVGEQDGLPYFSLEYVDGRPLDEEIDGKPLLPRRAAELTETVARAMHYAHEHDIVHRDLKPANILLTADGTPKVSDFGLVKRLEGDSSQTRTGTIMGTPSYMSPEQGRGQKDVGPLTDVYALGAILYCLLTGRPPFVAATAVDTVMQVLNDEPIPPSRLQAKTPRDLETIALKCLQKDPSRRYDNAAELADDLQRFLSGEPIKARPIGIVERGWRWCRRNPRVAVLAAVSMVFALTLMIGGPVVATLIYRQKQVAVRAQEAAETQRRVAESKEQIAIEAREQAQAAEHDAKVAQKLAEENEEKAEKAKAEAARQGILALDTLKRVVSEVQGQLVNQPRMQSLREKLLQTALQGLDQVANVDVGAKDLATAGARRRLGDIYLEMGQSDKALEQYAECYDLVTQLDEEEKLPNRHHNLSTALMNMAESARRASNPARAKEALLEALEIRREWAYLNPGHNYIPQNVADTLGKLGSVTLMLGQLEESHDYYEESLELRKEWLVWAPATATKPAMEVAGAHSAMGRVNLRLGDLDEAERYLELALDTLKQMAAERPNTRTFDWNVALFQNQLGAARLMAGKSEAAADTYAEALPVLQQFSDQDPHNAQLRRHVAEGLYGMATALLRLGDPAAAEHYRKALEIRRQLAEDDPTNAAEQVGWMLALGRCGQHEEAAKMAETVRESAANDSHLLYNVATGYAVCAQAVATAAEQDDSENNDLAQLRQQYGTLAIETLHAAVEHGYQVTAELELDPDLDGIRDRPEFQELLKKHRSMPESGETASS
jgi:serine/threonine-protein kinase